MVVFRVAADQLRLINAEKENAQQSLIELKKMLEQENIKIIFGPFLTNVYKGIKLTKTDERQIPYARRRYRRRRSR